MELTLQEAALAWAQGKMVEATDATGIGNFYPIGAVGSTKGHWNPLVFHGISSHKFRIAQEPPAKKFRPWTPDEVPVGAIFRRTHMIGWFAILGSGDGGVWFATPSFGIEQTDFDDLLKHYEHSIDGGKTWLPCGVEVDV